MSAITQWSLDLDEALRAETKLGLDVIRSGETREIRLFVQSRHVAIDDVRFSRRRLLPSCRVRAPEPDR